MSVVTTLTGLEQKTGSGKKGPWALSIFSAQNGQKYQTFESNIAAQANALIGRVVEIEFEEVERGEFTNNVLTSVTSATSGETPETASTTFRAVEASAVDDRQTMIMRQSALDRALTAFGIAGVDPLTDLDAVLELSDQFIEYFVGGRNAVGVVVSV